MRGDRHMGTVRSHNKTYRVPSPRRGLTKKQRAVSLHAIHNRGVATLDEPECVGVDGGQVEEPGTVGTEQT